MADGDRKIDSDGIRLLQDTGEQRLESDDDDCCCSDNCWKIAFACFCIEGDQFQDPLYIPCALVTEEIFFKGPINPIITTVIFPSNCYSVSPNSPEVTTLPDGTTEFTDLGELFDNCMDCCAPDPDVIQACCVPDEPQDFCIETTPFNCLLLNGVPQGAGTQCDDFNMCPPKPLDCPTAEQCLNLPDVLNVHIQGLGGLVTADFTSHGILNCQIDAPNYGLTYIRSPENSCIWRKEDPLTFDNIYDSSCFPDDPNTSLVASCSLFFAGGLPVHIAADIRCTGGEWLMNFFWRFSLTGSLTNCIGPVLVFNSSWHLSKSNIDNTPYGTYSVYLTQFQHTGLPGEVSLDFNDLVVIVG